MTSYMLNTIEDDLMDAFKSRLRIGAKPKYKHIFIDSGAANDEIIDYELEIHETSRKIEKTVSFKTSACIFPRTINLSNYEDVDTEEFNGSLFVHVR